MTLVKQAEKFTADHSPQILTAIGVAGTISTAVLTGKATIKAVRLMDARQRELDAAGTTHVIDFKEKVANTWKLYVPPVAAGVLTVASIITATQIGTRRAAAMASAVVISEKAFGEYKEKVLEKMGENKERAVRDDIAQDRVRNNPVTETTIYAARGTGKDLCYEPYTGRYFLSGMEDIKKAQNDLNYQVLNNYYASMSDFYDLLGLDRTKLSDDMGWNSDELLEIQFSSVLSDDDRPCLVMDYKVVPIKGYSRIS